MTIAAIVRKMSPFLRRKIEKIAEAKKITFEEAIIFCLKR